MTTHHIPHTPQMIDDLLLLKPGGRPIYFGAMGDHASFVVEYFETIPGVPTLVRGDNPAQWMMEVSSTQQEIVIDADLYDVYCNSELYRYAFGGGGGERVGNKPLYIQHMFTIVEHCMVVVGGGNGGGGVCRL